MLSTAQVAAVLETLETVAENGSVSPGNTLPEVGLTVTPICGGGDVPPRRCLRHKPRKASPTAKATRPQESGRNNFAFCAVALEFVRGCGRAACFLRLQANGQRRHKGKLTREQPAPRFFVCTKVRETKRLKTNSISFWQVGER